MGATLCPSPVLLQQDEGFEKIGGKLHYRFKKNFDPIQAPRTAETVVRITSDLQTPKESLRDLYESHSMHRIMYKAWLAWVLFVRRGFCCSKIELEKVAKIDDSPKTCKDPRSG